MVVVVIMIDGSEKRNRKLGLHSRVWVLVKDAVGNLVVFLQRLYGYNTTELNVLGEGIQGCFETSKQPPAHMKVALIITIYLEDSTRNYKIINLHVKHFNNNN